MLRERRRAHKVEEALEADLQIVRNMEPPGFRLDAALAKFARATRSDERAVAWAARVEQQPTSGMLANLIDRLGMTKLVVGGLLFFGGAATAGTLGVVAMRPSSPTRSVDGGKMHDPRPARSDITVTALPASAVNVSQTADAPPSLPTRRRPAAAVAARKGVEQEIAHIVMLRKLVEHNPRRALAWAEQGHRQFVDGALFEEREALYVLALIKVDGVNAAKPRALAFLRRFPKGSFAARIQHAVKR